MQVDYLDDKVRIISNIENCFATYKQVQDAFDIIDALRLQQKVSKKKGQNNCMFVGPSGVGKTEIIRAYCERPEVVPYEITDSVAKITAKRVMSINAPSPFSPNRFYKEILKQIGPFSPANVDRIRVSEMLNKIKLETLFVDEAQSILYCRGTNVVEGLEALKDLSNDIHANIVLFGVPGLQKLTQMDFQYYRRFDVNRLYPFKEIDDEFLSILKSIEEQIDAPFYLGFSDTNTIIPATLFKMCNGLISELMRVIKSIFYEAGLFNANVKISEMHVSLETIYNVRLKMLQNMDGEQRAEMLNRMNETSERMIDSKLKLMDASKKQKKNKP